jgi:hypothetical protein
MLFGLVFFISLNSQLFFVIFLYCSENPIKTIINFQDITATPPSSRQNCISLDLRFVLVFLFWISHTHLLFLFDGLFWMVSLNIYWWTCFFRLLRDGKLVRLLPEEKQIMAYCMQNFKTHFYLFWWKWINQSNNLIDSITSLFYWIVVMEWTTKIRRWIRTCKRANTCSKFKVTG